MLSMRPEMKAEWKEQVEDSINDLEVAVKGYGNSLERAKKDLKRCTEKLKLYQEELYRLNKEGD